MWYNAGGINEEREAALEEASCHRHDIDDRSWSIIEPLLPGQRGQWGGIAEDNRRFVNSVFWILRMGSPWRDLPPDYGGWKNTHRRFCRWRDKGVWEHPLEAVIDDPDFERLMVDSICAKVHHAGAEGGTEAAGLAKGGPTPRHAWPWMRMVCRSDSLSRLVPRRIASISGN